MDLIRFRSTDPRGTKDFPIFYDPDNRLCSCCSKMCNPYHWFMDRREKDNLISCEDAKCIEEVMSRTEKWLLSQKCGCKKDVDSRYTVSFKSSAKGDHVYLPTCSESCYIFVTATLLINEKRTRIPCNGCQKSFKFDDKHPCERCHIEWYCSKECRSLFKESHKEKCDLRQLDAKEVRKTIVDKYDAKESTNILAGLCICGKVANFQCSVCKRIKYCSKKCQTQHWVKHKSQHATSSVPADEKGDRKST